MSAYEKVNTFEEVKEGEFQSSRLAEGFPETDDDRLEFTQHIRMMAISALTAGGKVSADKDTISSLSKIIDGIDKQVINKKRLVVADKAAENDSKVALLLEEISTQFVRGEQDIGKLYQDKPKRDDKVFSMDMSKRFNDIDDQELELDRKEEGAQEFFDRMENQHEDLRLKG